MAVTKHVIIDVQEQGIDELNHKVNKLDKNLDGVDSSSKKASAGLKDVGDNGGAIAVLDSVTGGLATRIRDAAEASKLFSFSLKGMRTALIATGIGALVVALGTIALFWDEIVELIENANGKLQEQIDLSIKAQETTQLRIDILDKQIALNEKLGKGNELLQEQRIALVKILREQNAEEIAGLELQAEKLKTSTLELSTREKILRAVMNTISIGSGDAFIAEKQLEASKQYLDIQALILKAKGEQIDLDTKLFDLENPETDGGAGGTKREKVSTVGGELTTAQLTELETNAEFETRKTAQEADGAKAREIIAQLEAEAKAEALNSYANALADVSQLVGKETAAGKALAIASTLISTYLAAQQAYASQLAIPTPDAPIRAALAAGVAVASGLANVKAILAVKTPYGGSGGGGGGQTPSAPSFNVVGNSGASQIAQTINQDQQPVEAYVVAGNVSSAQELNRNIVETASIG